MKRLTKKRIKAALMRVLEKVANRIHPPNASGNNTSKM